MKTRIFILSIIMVLLAACSMHRPIQHPKIYDLGSFEVGKRQKTLPQIALAEVDAPNWLDSKGIIYRLAYKNKEEINSYAYSQLVTSPSNLTEDKLRAHLLQTTDILLVGIHVNNIPTLKVRIEDFSQTFTSPKESYVRIVLNTILYKGDNIIAQKTFEQKISAPTPNAEGAVKAFSQALDANIENLVQWMETLNLK